MSGCMIATVPASNAVMPPTHATTVIASGLASRNGCARHSRNTPAVTMVAAWISAETGVGPSIASGSHRCSGNCALLPIAATRSSSAIAVAVPLSMTFAPDAHRRVVERAVGREDQEHREQEPDVTDAVGDEGLLPRDRGGVALEPERDQQVRAEADALPPEEGHEEARAEHQDQHRRGEEVEVGEEPREARIAVHVADRVEVDERPDAGDEQDPRDRQRIGEEAHLHVEGAGRDPREDVVDVRAQLGGQVEHREEHHDRPREREPHQPGRDPARDGLADALPEEQQHHRTEQRQRGDDPDQVEQVARGHEGGPTFGRSRRRSRSSAVAPRRMRKIATMIARPDRDFGGRDREREEHDHLAVDVVELVGERDEREVHRVEHQLDAHEHHEHVAAHEHADRADGEEHRRQHQVVGVGDPHGISSSPTGLASSGSGVTSNFSPLRRASTTDRRPRARAAPR